MTMMAAAAPCASLRQGCVPPPEAAPASSGLDRLAAERLQCRCIAHRAQTSQAGQRSKGGSTMVPRAGDRCCSSLGAHPWHSPRRRLRRCLRRCRPRSKLRTHHHRAVLLLLLHLPLLTTMMSRKRMPRRATMPTASVRPWATHRHPPRPHSQPLHPSYPLKLLQLRWRTTAPPPSLWKPASASQEVQKLTTMTMRRRFSCLGSQKKRTRLACGDRGGS